MKGIKHATLVCDQELLEIWNQFTDASTTLTNTHLLMRLAARPFFDFFFEDVDLVVFSEENGIEAVRDARYREVLKSKRSQGLLEYKKAIEQISATSAETVVLLGNHMKLPDYFTKGSLVIRVGNVDMFGNVEGVWRGIRHQLNSRKFDRVFVAMGPERGWIVPRVASVYGVSVYDVSYALTPVTRISLTNLAKKVVKKMLRLLRRT